MTEEEVEEDTVAEAVAEDFVIRRCSEPLVTIAVKAVRSHLNLPATSQFIAVTVSSGMIDNPIQEDSEGAIQADGLLVVTSRCLRPLAISAVNVARSLLGPLAKSRSIVVIVLASRMVVEAVVIAVRRVGVQVACPRTLTWNSSL